MRFEPESDYGVIEIEVFHNLTNKQLEDGIFTWLDQTTDYTSESLSNFLNETDGYYVYNKRDFDYVMSVSGIERLLN